MACPDDNTLVAFVERALAPSAREQAAAHFEECPACRTILAALSTAEGEGRGAGDAGGRYELLSPLGAGGMGVVHSAFDRELDRRVALKFLSSDPSEDPARARGRLQREAQALAKLAHPNVITVHDVGVLDGEVFIAMELVKGSTLRTWLAGRHPLREVLVVLIQAGEGLAAAHAAGLVHRDFKPDNVLVGDDGRVRVTDFGLAHAADRSEPGGAPPSDASSGSTVTRTGVRGGTPAYMSPEQRLGRVPSALSDIYSYCVTLHEAVTGSRPGPTADPKRKVPSWLERVMARGLAERPEDRWPSMRAMLDELARRTRAGPRWVGAALGAVGVTALAIGGAHFVEHRADICTAPERQLETIWDAAAAARVKARLLDEGGIDGEPAWKYIQGILDRSASAWLSSYRDACNARGHDQTEAELHLRLDCLERQRRDLGAIVRFLQRPGSDVSKGPGGVAAALPLLGECSDAPSLSVVQPPPPARVEEVSSLEERLAAARVLAGVGRESEAIKELQAIAARAVEISYPSLEAEAAYELSSAQADIPDYPSVLQSSRVALDLAVRAHMDQLAARAAARQLVVSTMLGSPATELNPLVERAKLLASRVAGNDVVEADLEDSLANSASVVGDVAGQLEHARKTIDFAERGYGPDRPETLSALNNLAYAYDQSGRYDEELATLGKAKARVQELFGPQVNPMPILWANLGGVLLDLDRTDEAASVVDEGLSQVGEVKDPRTAMLWAERGVVQARRGSVEEAVASGQRALDSAGDSVGQDRADLLRNIEEIDLRCGRSGQAVSDFDQIVAIETPLLEPTSPRWVPFLMVGGRSLLNAGQVTKARDMLERAHTLSAAHPLPPGWVAAICRDLATAVWKSAGDAAAARDLLGQARAALGDSPRWVEERAGIASLEAAVLSSATHPRADRTPATR